MSRFANYSSAGFIKRIAQGVAVVLVTSAAFACSDQAEPTEPLEHPLDRTAASASMSSNLTPPPAIFAEQLTGRHRFTDDVAAQLRVKPHGRSTETINLKDASNIAVVRFTVQPGVRFPWHSHPGLVMVSVTQGSLTFVYADDCVPRQYPSGTAFVDPGFGNVHYAFNPTGGETVIVATFLGIPPTGALTNAVDAATSATLDAKCGVAAAMAHSH